MKLYLWWCVVYFVIRISGKLWGMANLEYPRTEHWTRGEEGLRITSYIIMLVVVVYLLARP